MDDLLYYRVEDDAMSGDRIFKGDVVIIRPQNEIKARAISLVIVDERIAIRRIKQHDQQYILIASNHNFTKIITDDIHVLGKVVFNSLKY